MIAQMKACRIFILLLFIPFLVQSQKMVRTDNLLEKALDSFVDKTVRPFIGQPSKVGVSIGIYKMGETYSYHYGSTQIDKQLLPSDRSIYEIGSISKTFTGTLLAQAVKEGKLKMNDDIRLYLDGNYPNLEFNGKPIRLYQLVSHISGLPFFMPDQPELFQHPNYDSLPFVLTRIQQAYSKEQFMADLHLVKLDTVPGYNFHYSNAGAQLMKYILEKIYSKPFDKILEIYITRPLSMSSTNSSFSKNNSKQLAKGYSEKGNLMPYNPPLLDAAGGIYSTVPDMIKYLKFHLDETNEVVDMSHRITYGNINKYAIGLNWQEQMTPRKYKKLWQSGGTFGFSSYCVIYPALQIAIVMLTNESDQHSQGEMEDMADKIFEKINK
jgi:CubicO group peptidase (beta-lactamase class C family)